MKPRLIALCGAARNGKTTAANYLADQHGYVPLKFSGPLKDLCLKGLEKLPPDFYINQLTAKELHNYNRDREAYWWDKIHANRNEFSRWLLQYVGTEIGRAYDPHIWVKLWCQSLGDMLAKGYNVVTEDLRFPNEEEAVRRLHGYTSKIWRVIRTDADAPLIESGADHESETYYTKIEPDAVVAAPFGIHFVHEAVEKLLTEAVTG